jgi:hypothetical protein
MLTYPKRIVSGVLTAVALMAAAVASAQTAATTAERRFQAEVVSVDPAARTAVLRHKPTGFEVAVAWDEQTRLSVRQRRDIDEVPLGWVNVWTAVLDETKGELTPGRLDPLPQAPAQPGAPRAKGFFPARLVRETLPPGKQASPPTWTNRAGDAAYYLEAGGRRWSFKPVEKRRLFEFFPSATSADLAPGVALRELVYREGPAGARLVSAMIEPHRFIAEHAVGLASGTTPEILDQEIAKVRAAHAALAPELYRQAAPVSLRVDPELARVGEPVRVRFEVWSARPPSTELVLEASYLRPAEAKTTALTLAWKAGPTEGGLTLHRAELALPALPVGQHVVRWKSDVGGDIPEFWRSFAVLDDQTLVWKLQFTAGAPNTEFEEFFLPYDYWEEAAFGLLGGPFGARTLPKTAADWLKPSREFRRRGAMPSSHIIQANYAGRTGWPAPKPVQFCEEPEAVQRKVLGAAVEFMGLRGFRREDIGFSSYEFSTKTVNFAHEAGVRLIGSLCIHQNWQDGSWGINHTARPLRPYFSARDDFRRAGPGGPDGMVMTSQHDKSILWTEYGLGVFEPAWLERAWVGGGGGGRTVYDDVFMSRHYDLVHASLENIVNQRVPYFGSIGLEFSTKDPENINTKPNGLLLRELVAQARRAKVVFAHQAAVAEYYRRHYTETPETLFYDADFWAGMKADESVTSTWKPVVYPDLIHIENTRFSAFFKRPAALPEYHWDYTKPWDYPNWGNESLPRNVIGVLVPGEHDKFAVTPSITDTRPLRVAERRTETAAGLELVLTVESDRALTAFPLAVWDLPREWQAGDKGWKIEGARRFVPIRAPYTGNLNGVIEADLKPGKNVIRLLVSTPARTLRTQDVAAGDVRAKVFTRNDTSTAYVWSMKPWATEFTLTVPEGKSVQFYAAPQGKRVDLPPGTHRLTIPQEKWARVVGLPRDELAAALAP